MPLFTLRFEDVAFFDASADDDLDFELSPQEVDGFAETRIQEGTLPPMVRGIGKVYATADDSVYENGVDDGQAKLFVCIELIVEAEDEDGARYEIDTPSDLLSELTDMMSPDMGLEGNWEIAETEPFETPLAIVQTDAERDEGDVLYWSNEDGWVDSESATTFTPQQSRALPAPMGGQWVAAPQQPGQAPTANP